MEALRNKCRISRNALASGFKEPWASARRLIQVKDGNHNIHNLD